MTSARIAPNGTPGTTDTRQRLIDVAVDLCARNSFAGTSLQMIANELGLTKAAIYHHFRTREDLLRAIVDPILGELRRSIEAAESQRTPNARADAMLVSFAAITVRNRSLFAVLSGDPSVGAMLRTDRTWGDLIGRQTALIAGVEPGPSGTVKASVLMAGIAMGSAPAGMRIADDELLRHLVDGGRRMLGLRATRKYAGRS